MLKRYEEGLQRSRRSASTNMPACARRSSWCGTGQGQVRDETRHLVNALRASPKARGRWGEQSLRNVLEQAGLSEHVDFQTEVSVEGDDGRLAARRRSSACPAAASW